MLRTAGAQARSPFPNLKDRLGRSFPYLRLSITEHCNFRCSYCLPQGYQGGVAASEFLSLAEIRRLTNAFVGLGVEKIRITGGEPTLRPDLEAIISMMRENLSLKKIALSTNGHDLQRNVARYRQAGLTHLNVSLDDVDPQEFFKQRGRDLGPKVLAGIDAALEAGFSWVKINAVLTNDSYESRIQRFLDWVRVRPVSVRFIELMQTVGREDYHLRHHLAASKVHSSLIQRGWVPEARERDAGPAVEYSHPESIGKMGLIAPYSPGFCDTCNRLRVSSLGKLQLCLFGTGHVSLRDLLQKDEDTVILQERIAEALQGKKVSHFLNDRNPGENYSFSSIGG